MDLRIPPEEEAYLFKELLQKIHRLATSRASAGLAMYARRKAFISYAWESDPAENKLLQDWLQKLQGDLQTAGLDCFLDVADMSGNMSDTMRENIEASDVALIIGTPRLGERAAQKTNVAFEIENILRRSEEGKIKVLPLLRTGDFGVSLPKSLLSFLVRDCRKDEDYKSLMISLTNPLGIVPAIWDFRVGEMAYEGLLREYESKKAMNARMGPLAMAANIPDRIEHQLKVHKDARVKLSPEASREFALELEQKANEAAALGTQMDLLTQKMLLDSALPYFEDGFGVDHEKTVEVRRVLGTLSHLSASAPMAMSGGDMATMVSRSMAQAPPGMGFTPQQQAGMAAMLGSPAMQAMMQMGAAQNAAVMQAVMGGGAAPVVLGGPGAAPVVLGGPGAAPVVFGAPAGLTGQQAAAMQAAMQIAAHRNAGGAVNAMQAAQHMQAAMAAAPADPAAMSPTPVPPSSVMGMTATGSPAVNPFMLIHEYLLGKLADDKGRIKDFSDLLSSLKVACTVVAVQAHLAGRPDFHHHSAFKGNRYHDLRNKIVMVGSNDLLASMFADYCTFLTQPARDAADSQLKAKLAPCVAA